MLFAFFPKFHPLITEGGIFESVDETLKINLLKYMAWKDRRQWKKPTEIVSFPNNNIQKFSEVTYRNYKPWNHSCLNVKVAYLP